jgi:hypothetical protein
VGTEAGAPPNSFHVAFVPSAGEAAGPPIVPVIMMRFAWTRDGRTCGRRGRRPSNRARDNDAIRLDPRRSYLEGRRPRRLVATLDVQTPHGIVLFRDQPFKSSAQVDLVVLAS